MQSGEVPLLLARCLPKWNFINQFQMNLHSVKDDEGRNVECGVEFPELIFGVFSESVLFCLPLINVLLQLRPQQCLTMCSCLTYVATYVRTYVILLPKLEHHSSIIWILASPSMVSKITETEKGPVKSQCLTFFFFGRGKTGRLCDSQILPALIAAFMNHLQ